MISVHKVSTGDPMRFEVEVREGEGKTRHTVSLSRDVYERLTQAGASPDDLVEASFRFLLDREPKEAILTRFDLTVISQYFPEFEKKIPEYLKSG